MASGSEAAAAINPAATGHLPVFIAFPGQGDWLMMGVGIVLLMMIVGIGVLYLRLHALPEHMAHRGQKVQYEIVAVLALIALFTHNHAFWIAGLLLALIPMPDFMSPLRSMAGALNRIADKPDGSLPPRDPGA